MLSEVRPDNADSYAASANRLSVRSCLLPEGQFGAALAHEPVVLKATGDCVESARFLEAKLFGRLSESDPGLIGDQGKELVTTTTRAGRGRGRASARVRRRGLLLR